MYSKWQFEVSDQNLFFRKFLRVFEMIKFNILSCVANMLSHIRVFCTQKFFAECAVIKC